MSEKKLTYEEYAVLPIMEVRLLLSTGERISVHMITCTLEKREGKILTILWRDVPLDHPGYMFLEECLALEYINPNEVQAIYTKIVWFPPDELKERGDHG